MRVKLEDLLPYALRDFTIDPIDDEAVRRLSKSVKEKGFWGGVVGRKVNGGVELLAGAHRVKAAIKAGIEQAEIYVGEFDDDAALDVYYSENALQRNNSGTALMGAITSAVKLEAQRALATVSPQVGERSSGEVKSLDIIRGQVCSNKGIGEDVLQRRFPAISHHVIEHQLANLKKSIDPKNPERTNYARLIAEVYAGMKKNGFDQATLDLAAQAAAAAGNAIPTFDYVGVAQHLKQPNLVDAFRKIVTGDGIIAYKGHPGYLAVDGQAGVAEKLVALAEKRHTPLTVTFIRANFMDQLKRAKHAERKLNKAEKDALRRKSWEHNMRDLQHDISRAAGRCLTIMLGFARLTKDRPAGVTLHVSGELHSAMLKLEKAQALFNKALGNAAPTKDGKSHLKLIAAQ